jgi:hypothetical protein
MVGFDQAGLVPVAEINRDRKSSCNSLAPEVMQAPAVACLAPMWAAQVDGQRPEVGV